MQDTLANLESGHADKVAQAQSAAEERARQSQEMEMRHIAELKSLEDKMNESKAKYQVRSHNDLYVASGINVNGV